MRRGISRSRYVLLAAVAAAFWHAPSFGAEPHAFGNPALVQQPPRRTYHVENYRLTLRFEQAKGEIFGDEEVTLRPLGSGLRRG